MVSMLYHLLQIAQNRPIGAEKKLDLETKRRVMLRTQKNEIILTRPKRTKQHRQ